MYPELFVIPFGRIVVNSYGLLLVLGFSAAILVARRRCRRVGEDQKHVLWLAVLYLCFGTFGARLLHVLYNWESLRDIDASPLDVKSGGLDFVGGFCIAFVVTIIYSRIRRVSALQLMDIISPTVALALAFARMGCFLNGCCFGAPSQLPWAVRFPAIVYVTDAAQGSGPTVPRYSIPFAQQLLPDVSRNRPALLALPDDYYQGYLTQAGNWVSDQALVPVEKRSECFRVPKPAHRLTAQQQRDLVRGCCPMHPVHPTQLYALANALILFGLLNLLFRWRSYRGQVFLGLLLLYGATRFLLEFLRNDSPLEFTDLTMPQHLCLTLFPLGAGALWFVRRRHRASRAAAGGDS